MSSKSIGIHPKYWKMSKTVYTNEFSSLLDLPPLHHLCACTSHVHVCKHPGALLNADLEHTAVMCSET
eukprot:4328868-Amphidinium_carterae.2